MIHRIGRADDPRIAAYAHVGDHAWLIAENLFVAEGRFVVERMIDAARYDVASVLVTPAAWEALRPRLEPLVTDVCVAGQDVVNSITGFTFHRGCLALVRRPAPLPLDRFFGARRLLILEGVGNPDNIGGLFRVAAALGSDGILLDPRSADPLYRKAIRTSMGAALSVPFTRIDSGLSGAAAWPDFLNRFADRGFTLLALTPELSARPLSEVAAAVGGDDRIALMVGAEGAGLSVAALAAAQHRVRIPIAPDVDSLNVVVAAAIALYAFHRQP